MRKLKGVAQRNSASSVRNDTICEGHRGYWKRRRPSTHLGSPGFGKYLALWLGLNVVSELRCVYSQYLHAATKLE